MLIFLQGSKSDSYTIHYLPDPRRKLLPPLENKVLSCIWSFMGDTGHIIVKQNQWEISKGVLKGLFCGQNEIESQTQGRLAFALMIGASGIMCHTFWPLSKEHHSSP